MLTLGWLSALGSVPTAIKHERKSPGRVNECSCKVQTQRGQTLQTGAGNHLLLRKPPLDTTRALMETWPCASSTSRQTAAYTLSAHHNKHVRWTPVFSPCRAPSWERRREASDYHNSTQQVTQLQMLPILGDKMWGFLHTGIPFNGRNVLLGFLGCDVTFNSSSQNKGFTKLNRWPLRAVVFKTW